MIPMGLPMLRQRGAEAISKKVPCRVLKIIQTVAPTLKAARSLERNTLIIAASLKTFC